MMCIHNIPQWSQSVIITITHPTELYSLKQRTDNSCEVLRLITQPLCPEPKRRTHFVACNILLFFVFYHSKSFPLLHPNVTRVCTPCRSQSKIVTRPLSTVVNTTVLYRVCPLTTTLPLPRQDETYLWLNHSWFDPFSNIGVASPWPVEWSNCNVGKMDQAISRLYWTYRHE